MRRYHQKGLGASLPTPPQKASASTLDLQLGRRTIGSEARCRHPEADTGRVAASRLLFTAPPCQPGSLAVVAGLRSRDVRGCEACGCSLRGGWFLGRYESDVLDVSTVVVVCEACNRLLHQQHQETFEAIDRTLAATLGLHLVRGTVGCVS